MEYCSTYYWKNSACKSTSILQTHVVEVVVNSLSHVWLSVTPWTAARKLPHSSPSSGVCLNSCPLSWWYHPTISSSASPFSSYPQSFPASGSCLMSWLFTSGGQCVRDSASAFHVTDAIKIISHMEEKSTIMVLLAIYSQWVLWSEQRRDGTWPAGRTGASLWEALRIFALVCGHRVEKIG